MHFGVVPASNLDVPFGVYGNKDVPLCCSCLEISCIEMFLCFFSSLDCPCFKTSSI